MLTLLRAGALALACFLLPSIASAQHATRSASYSGDTAPEHVPITVAATSTPTTGSTSVSATVAFTPQLGRPIRLVAKLTAGSIYAAQVFTSPDGCTTLNPLTIAGQVWATYSGQTTTINEDVDTPFIAGIVYCLTVTPGSGATVSYAVRQ